MATFTKAFLSGSTNGALLDVVETATPGVLLHTAHATAKDEVWIYAFNTDSVKRVLTFEFGGVAAKDLIVCDLVKAGSGLVLVIPGNVLSGGLIVRAFADSANKISILGWVNRIT